MAKAAVFALVGRPGRRGETLRFVLTVGVLMDGGYYAPNITYELLPSVSQTSTEGACVHGGCAQAKGCFSWWQGRSDVGG